jgi:hypothetical protein
MTMQSYLNRVARKNQINCERLRDFENTFYRCYAYIPTRVSSGRWVWNQSYWVRYQAKIKPGHKKSVAAYYLSTEFIKGKPIEKLDDREMIVRKLSSCAN